MLALVVISMVLLPLCLALHYSQHFLFQPCTKSTTINPSVPTANSPSETKQYRCCAIFISLDVEHNLFPPLFVLYIVLLLFLCIIISITETKMASTEINVMDWIIIYGTLISCIFESFFSFYQYLVIMMQSDTKSASNSFSKNVQFIFYCISFILIFIVQIHFIYWLWPLLFLSHLIFNVYCTWTVSSYLIERYSIFGIQHNYINYHILSSVYFMRRTLIICCILQSICFTLLISLYHINDSIYSYIPTFWSVCCILYTINFIKNRQWIKENLFKLYQFCKHNRITTWCHDMKQYRNTQRILDQQNFINYQLNDIHLNNVAQQRIQNVIQREEEEEEKKQEIIPKKEETPSSKKVTFKDEEKEIHRSSVVFNHQKYLVEPPKNTNKAIELLGLTPTASNTTNKSITDRLMLTIAQSFSHRRHAETSYITMNEEEELEVEDLNETYSKKPRFMKVTSMIAKKRRKLPLKATVSSPVVLEQKKKKKQSKQNHLLEHEWMTYDSKEEEEGIETENRYRISISDEDELKELGIDQNIKLRLQNNLSAPYRGNGNEKKKRRAHSDRDILKKSFVDNNKNKKFDGDTDEEVDDGFVYHDHDEENEEEDIEFELITDDDFDEIDFNDNNDNNEYNEDNMDHPVLDDVVQSMHSLVKFGFCEQKSVKDLQQLTLYQQQKSNTYK